MYVNHALGATETQQIVAAPPPKTFAKFFEDVAWGIAVGVGIEVSLKMLYSLGILKKRRSSRTSSVL